MTKNEMQCVIYDLERRVAELTKAIESALDTLENEDMEFSARTGAARTQLWFAIPTTRSFSR